VAELRHVLGLVAEIAGRPRTRTEAEGLDEAARIEAAYARAWPISQRRFERLAAETATSAAAGVEVLIALEEQGRPTRAAARRIADHLEEALKGLAAAISA
jgi:hypothetical protein